MTVTVADLKDQTGMPEPRPVLLCSFCDETYSANKGDYFHHAPQFVFKCPWCGQLLELVIKKVVYERITP
jgi:hydrogenase maturation factor HypF (carbamoyltransferase family)